MQERQELQIMLQQLRSELEEEIKRERNNHFQKFASKLNHKHNPDVYRVIKGIEKPAMPKLTSVSIKRKDGTVVTDAQEKVEALAEQYQSPLGIDQPNNIERITIMEQLRSENKKEEQATHEDFTLSEVKIAREQMSDKKAPGQSRVAKEDFETAGQELDVLVQTLANKICKTGKWPKVLKTQVVCPLLKKPEKKDQINQDETRPISLLETLDKWVQKLIYNRIRRHVKFNESQIGYEKGCDLHTTLLSEHIHKHCLSHNIVLFTDISKAFDSVPLHELEIAIWNSTIPTIYKPTMIDFTKGRKYRVEMQVENRDTVSSDWYDQQYGTPQGSVLGPLLWNLFFDPLLEDLSKIQHSLPGLDLAFADDLTILATAQDPRQAEKLIEEKLKCINEFLIERGMQLSIPKLKIMCIRMAADVYLPSVFLNDIKIQTTEAHKFLGVTYDPKFTFQSHLKSLKEKIANRTRAMVYMRGARWGPTQSTMMALYHSYITSVVLNGMMAWYPFLNKRQINSLNADLKRAIRIALGLPRLTPVSVVFIESGADTVNQLANKSAASLYAQINPYSKESNNIAKNHYIIQTPKWARNHLLKSLNSVWKTPLQNRNVKEFLITDNISIHTSTLTNQKETEESENTHDVLLYTDASVNQESIPPGQAAIGYIWYIKHGDYFSTESKKSAWIGNGHSSFTAEAIAITEAMKNQPKCIKATQNIGIFTDSLSNLKQIEKGIATGTEQRNLFEILNQKQNKMTFYHTKSHIGIKKNEEVDELCSTNKSDIDRVKLVQHGERTVMQVKESMNKAMTQIRLDNLKKQAINSKSARLYKNMLDKLKEPPKQHKDLPRKAGVLLTKARVNRWTSCQVFLKRINVRENHNCIICQEKDTTKHQLVIIAGDVLNG